MDDMFCLCHRFCPCILFDKCYSTTLCSFNVVSVFTFFTLEDVAGAVYVSHR